MTLAAISRDISEDDRRAGALMDDLRTAMEGEMEAVRDRCRNEQRRELEDRSAWSSLGRVANENDLQFFFLTV